MPSRFSYSQDFLLDNQPVKIISGAVHYFRHTPGDWAHSLHNLRALGANTVETYVPWNLHEPREGEFRFQDEADLQAFLALAQEMGLWVILRLSPYICAEWEFGGLPAWLLKRRIGGLRTSDPVFVESARPFLNEVLRRVTPLQIDCGGPIIMMQVENEYGSFGEDQRYLSLIRQLFLEAGVTVPLVTSDGGWQTALYAGHLRGESVLPTANFGSDTQSNFDALAQYMADNDIVGPLMCMEFWCGWFNRWGEEVIVRDPQETAREVDAILARGHINIYMFHGGTNFGFWNASCDVNREIRSQVTSYDYDAPLNEAGNPTEKYYAIRDVVAKYLKEPPPAPRVKPSRALPPVALSARTSLFSTLKTLSEPVSNRTTLPMEQLDQALGYTLYRTHVKRGQQLNKLRLMEASDRAQIFINQQWVATQSYQELGDPVMLDDAQLNLPRPQLDILVENMGRNCYGPKLLAPTQSKGIRSGVMLDLHFLFDWQHFPLSLENIGNVDFAGEWQPGVPAFYAFDFDIDGDICDSWIDCSAWGKGCAFINGFALGRYWSRGPIAHLYLPHDRLKKTNNRVVIFETEGAPLDELRFAARPARIDNRG